MSRVLTQLARPTTSEIDTPVAQPLPPTVAARVEQPHTHIASHTLMDSSPMPKQSSSLRSIPRQKVKSSLRNAKIARVARLGEKLAVEVKRLAFYLILSIFMIFMLILIGIICKI
jgi:hypothetical protein